MQVQAYLCPFVRPGIRSKRWVAFEVIPGSEPAPKRHKARAAIGLCLDVSGSMRGRAMQDLKEAAKAVVDSFPHGHVEIVTFARSATVLPAGEDAKAAIDELRAAGPTAMLEGIQTTLRQLQDHHSGPEVLRRLFLLTDGRPNIPDAGPRDGEGAPLAMYALAQIARQKLRCPITTFGLGNEYSPEILQNIAGLSGGEFYDVAKSGAIAGAISKAAAFVRTVVFTDCHLDVWGIRGGKLESIFGRPGGSGWPLGDLYLGDRSTVLVEAEAPAGGGSFLSWKLSGCSVGTSQRRILAEGTIAVEVSATADLADPRPVVISRLLHSVSSRTAEVLCAGDTALELQRKLVADLEQYAAYDTRVKAAAAHQRRVLQALEHQDLKRAHLYQRHSAHYYRGTQRNRSFDVVVASM